MSPGCKIRRVNHLLTGAEMQCAQHGVYMFCVQQTWRKNAEHLELKSFQVKICRPIVVQITNFVHSCSFISVSELFLSTFKAGLTRQWSMTVLEMVSIPLVRACVRSSVKLFAVFPAVWCKRTVTCESFRFGCKQTRVVGVARMVKGISMHNWQSNFLVDSFEQLFDTGKVLLKVKLFCLWQLVIRWNWANDPLLDDVQQ